MGHLGWINTVVTIIMFMVLSSIIVIISSITGIDIVMCLVLMSNIVIITDMLTHCQVPENGFLFWLEVCCGLGVNLALVHCVRVVQLRSIGARFVSRCVPD